MTAAVQPLEFYAPDQPRDERGRFGEGSGAQVLSGKSLERFVKDQTWFHSLVVPFRLNPDWYMHVGTRKAAEDRFDPTKWDAEAIDDIYGDNAFGDKPVSASEAMTYELEVSPSATVAPTIYTDEEINDGIIGTSYPGGSKYDVYAYTNDMEDKGSISLLVRGSALTEIGRVASVQPLEFYAPDQPRDERGRFSETGASSDARSDSPEELIRRLIDASPEGVKALFGHDPQDMIATDLNLDSAPTMAQIEATRALVAEKSQETLRQIGQPEMMTVYRGGPVTHANNPGAYTSVTLDKGTAKFFGGVREDYGDHPARGASHGAYETYQLPISKVAAYIPAMSAGWFDEKEIYTLKADLGDPVSSTQFAAVVPLDVADVPEYAPAIRFIKQEMAIEFYSPDQPRDERGRFGESGGSGGEKILSGDDSKAIKAHLSATFPNAKITGIGKAFMAIPPNVRAGLGRGLDTVARDHAQVAKDLGGLNFNQNGSLGLFELDANGRGVVGINADAIEEKAFQREFLGSKLGGEVGGPTVAAVADPEKYAEGTILHEFGHALDYQAGAVSRGGVGDGTVHDGVMVAWVPPRSVAEALALPGGEDAQRIHLTLVYLGKASEMDPSQVTLANDVVASLASSFTPFTAEVSGTGFFDTEDGTALVALIDAPELPELYDALCEALESVGLPVSHTHGFTPHMTLAYIDSPNTDQRAAAGTELRIGSLSVVAAADGQTYEMGGTVASVQPLEFGDFEGHPFRGNQYTGGHDVSLKEAMDDPQQFVGKHVTIVDVKRQTFSDNVPVVDTVHMNVVVANRVGGADLAPGMNGAGLRLGGVLTAPAFGQKEGEEFIFTINDPSAVVVVHGTVASAVPLEFYSEDQQRDERGRWSSDGGLPSDPRERIPAVTALVEKALKDGRATEDVYDKLPGGRWTAEREALHHDIVQDILARNPNVDHSREAIILGGIGGSGKTTLLDGGYLGIDSERFLTISPDLIKEELAMRGEVPEIPGVKPMEENALVHEEASKIAWDLANVAVVNDMNVVWDVTMSSPRSVLSRMEDLNDEGYNTRVVFANTTLDVAQQRAEERYIKNQDSDLGGRLLLPALYTQSTDPAWGTVNRSTFEAVKSQANSWEVWDTSGSTPVFVERSQP